jgi:hypothetical protein
MKALILSAADPYQDRWHGLRTTTARMQQLLVEDGLHVVVSESVTEVTDGLPDTSLLVVNLAGASGADPHAAALDEAIARHVRAGRPILAMHSSIIALRDLPHWRRSVGGAWRAGVSMHPQIGRHPVALHPHPIDPGFDELAPYDERYSALDVDPDTLTIASHIHDGVRHDLAWSKEHDSGSRCVVNALGHGSESFDDPRHRALIRHMVAWALAPVAGADTKNADTKNADTNPREHS